MANLLLFLAIFAWFLASCATSSTPHFYPSKPLAGVKNATEGLRLCSEYKFPEGVTTSSVLTPMLSCVDQVMRDHLATAPDAAQVFQAELHSHELLRSPKPGQAPSFDFGADFEEAMHLALRSLSTPVVLTDRDRALLKRHFYRTERLL